MGLSSCLRNLDNYGKPISLYHSGRRNQTTCFGGLCRLLSLAAIGALVYFIILPMILEKKAYTYKSTRIKHPLGDDETWTLDHPQSFNISVVIEQGVQK